MPDMTHVASSNIAAAGYDAEARELHIAFRSGGVYIYSGADEALLQELIGSPSPGRFFAQNIKGVYPYRPA